MEYFCILLFLLIGVFRYDFYNHCYYRKVYFYFISILLFSLSAFSYRIGVNDVIAYMSEYDLSQPLTHTHFAELFGNFNRRPAWNILIALCKDVCNDYVVYKIIHAFFVNFTIIYFLRCYSSKIFIALLLYFLTFYSIFNFDIMRESLAACCFIWALHYYRQNKWLKYYLWTILATQFHISALFLFFIPILKLIPVTKRLLIVSIFLILFCLCVYPYVNNFFMALGALEQMGSFGDKAVGYLSREEYKGVVTLGSIFKSLSLNAIPPFIIMWYYIKEKRIEEYWLIPLVIIFVIISILNISTPIFYRFLNYFWIIYVLLITDACDNLLHVNMRVLQRQLVVITLIFLTIYRPIKVKFLPSPENPNVPIYTYYYPYYSVFSKYTDRKREAIRVY